MTTYNKIITEEGKNEVLKIAFSNETAESTFKYLALGTSGSEASTTGSATDFHELSGNQYHRESSTNDDVNVASNGTITLSFTFSEDNYNGDEAEITEIALCNDYEGSIEDAVCFAFIQVPNIAKTGNISLKYTIMISIE